MGAKDKDDKEGLYGVIARIWAIEQLLIAMSCEIFTYLPYPLV